MMTVYDATSRALLDAAGVDVLLVGDSVEMTVYGEAVDALGHDGLDGPARARAVSRAAKRALVVGDMPFLSYQADVAEAVAQRRPLPVGGGLRRPSKVEGGRRVLPAIEAILAADIPVMGHLGLTPAVLPQARRVQGPGPRRPTRRRRSSRTPRRSPRPGASRSCSSACPTTLAAEITRTIPDPDDRHRRRRRAATARSSSSTTSWA